MCLDKPWILNYGRDFSVLHSNWVLGIQKTKTINPKTSLALYPRVSLNIGDINQVLCKFPPWRVTSHLPNSQIFNIKNSSNVMVLSHVVPNLWLNQSFGPFFTFSWTCLQSTVCLSVGKTINSSRARVIFHIFASSMNLVVLSR